VPIVGVLHHFLLHDQVVFVIHGELHVVTDSDLLLPTAVGVRQRYFALLGLDHRGQQLFILSLAAFEFVEFGLQLWSAGLARHPCALLVLLIELVQIVINAFFHLFHQFLHLLLGVMPPDVIDCFELTAVNGHQFGAKQIQLAAEQIKLSEQWFESLSVVLTKISNRFEIRP
jgi:hypothetical protein